MSALPQASANRRSSLTSAMRHGSLRQRQRTYRFLLTIAVH
jgi:hypothetical protein